MTRPIRKVLVANRGEIACRVITACREMDLATVAVYSEADLSALHVQLADQAVAIGPPPAASSYLDIDRLIAAARATGADALHPGYGFRSESAELARACERAEILFIGPSPDSLERLGDKRAARALAREARVATVPGYEGDPEGALEAARAMGYPVLVKAAAGGGGKGMRRVDEARDLPDALTAAARVAATAFGDASVYLERWLVGTRHVEVQILGDGRGHAIHLFERECSLQRRHQKVIEESPSPVLDPDLRGRLTAAAVALAARARYRSAGTCEFLLTPSGEFFFLEMNTRIQVEHPVTEACTGVDLVRAQLTIAMGEPLPAQESIVPRGHAVEARLLAEDPVADFLPQSGRLLRFDIPRTPFLRVDAGFAAGSEIPVAYDSLLAKIVAWGPDRKQAWKRLGIALDGASVHGVRTNLPFLRFLARDPQVLAGEFSTTTLEDELVPRFRAAALGPPPLELLAAVAVAEALTPAPSSSLAPGASDAAAAAAGASDPFRALGQFRLRGLD